MKHIVRFLQTAHIHTRAHTNIHTLKHTLHVGKEKKNNQKKKAPLRAGQQFQVCIKN